MLKVSSLKIAAHRPHYLPDFYYFYKIYCSDKFLISDFLGFRKQSPIVRANFDDFLLTIPVYHKKTDPHPPIIEMEMLDQNLWREKQLKTLKSKFSALPFFEHYYPDLVEIFHHDEKSLNQFLLDIILWLLKIILPDKKIQICSKIGIKHLESLHIWLGQFDKFQWLIYREEKSYYKNHFPSEPLHEIPNMNPLPFPASYSPSMSILKLLFLSGPEVILYFG
jgi:hypothetical protein